MAMCTKALLGDPLPMLDSNLIPCNSAINSINNVLKTHKKFWPNLQYGMSLPKEKLLPKLKKISNKFEEQGRNVDKPKQTESKIALEGIESEKLDLNLAIDKNCLNLVTDEEISKLTCEVENIKIKNSELHAMKSETVEVRKNPELKQSEAKNLDGTFTLINFNRTNYCILTEKKRYLIDSFTKYTKMCERDKPTKRQPARKF